MGTFLKTIDQPYANHNGGGMQFGKIVTSILEWEMVAMLMTRRVWAKILIRVPPRIVVSGQLMIKIHLIFVYAPNFIYPNYKQISQGKDVICGYF